MKASLIEVLQNIIDIHPVLSTRIPKSNVDFGDDRTIGLKLKSTKRTLVDYRDHDFGYFLGEYKGKWYVGTHQIMSFVPSLLAEYNSLEDLKRNWILD